MPENETKTPSAEELAAAIARELETRSAPQPAPPQPEKFSMDEFAKKFLENAPEAMDYLDRTTVGFPVRKIMPALAAGYKELNERLQEMEVSRFRDSHPDVEKYASTLDGILAERNWTPTYKNLSDAWNLAKAQGLIKEETQTKEELPPHIPNHSPAMDTISDEQLRELEKKTPEELKEMIEDLKARM